MREVQLSFPQVVTSHRSMPSSTRTAVTTWTPSQSSAQVRTGALLRLKLLNLSWWRPMPIIRENLVFTFLGQRLNHPWNIVCRKFILSRTWGFLFCSEQISIRFLQDKADRTCEGAKFLTTYEMHYQMNGDSFSFIKGRCNIHI